MILYDSPIEFDGPIMIKKGRQYEVQKCSDGRYRIFCASAKKTDRMFHGGGWRVWDECKESWANEEEAEAALWKIGGERGWYFLGIRR